MVGFSCFVGIGLRHQKHGQSTGITVPLRTCDLWPSGRCNGLYRPQQTCWRRPTWTQRRCHLLWSRELSRRSSQERSLLAKLVVSVGPFVIVLIESKLEQLDRILHLLNLFCGVCSHRTLVLWKYICIDWLTSVYWMFRVMHDNSFHILCLCMVALFYRSIFLL